MGAASHEAAPNFYEPPAIESADYADDTDLNEPMMGLLGQHRVAVHGSANICIIGGCFPSPLDNVDRIG